MLTMVTMAGTQSSPYSACREASFAKTQSKQHLNTPAPSPPNLFNRLVSKPESANTLKKKVPQSEAFRQNLS